LGICSGFASSLKGLIRGSAARIHGSAKRQAPAAVEAQMACQTEEKLLHVTSPLSSASGRSDVF
jgi:hypothetical protein